MRCSLIFGLLAICCVNGFGQSDLSVGNSFNLNLQRQNINADAFLLHNSYYHSSSRTLAWTTTHSTFGTRGIQFSYVDGIHFFADSQSSTAGSTFTPVSKFFIGNNGNIGVGTIVPSVWYGNTKVLEIAYNRPVLKMHSTQSNELATLMFTNTAVNSTTHLGEFHVNYQYDAANANGSALRFYSYPGGEQLTLKANGNIGVGLVNPATKLEVGGTLRATDYILGNNFVSVEKSGSYRVSMNGQSHGYITGRNDSSEEKFLINSNGNSYFKGGNVGIGTSIPDQALTVNGIVHAEEVIIEPSVPAPDYVFEQNYFLTPLDEVQAYIAKHRHLPEVPSAKEMERNGVKVGEMEMILLKKIEELTLYLLKQQTQLEEQNKEIQKLKTGQNN
jgi:hypothetical protein